MGVIIKSTIKGQENWEGKGFSSYPAKIYLSFDDACDALKGYWFNEYCFENKMSDSREIRIVPLSEAKQEKLLLQNKIRW